MTSAIKWFELFFKAECLTNLNYPEIKKFRDNSEHLIKSDPGGV
jgi:hypothetical protein